MEIGGLFVKSAIEAHIASSLMGLVVPIGTVKPDPHNVRMHSQANLAAIRCSLEAYGQRKPIVVNRVTGVIEAGNGMWQVAMELGWDSIAVTYVDDSPEMATAYAIMDNRSAELAEWDLPNLKDILESLDDGVFDVNLKGFDEKALSDLITQFYIPKPGLIDEDEIPEITKESYVKLGDLWQLGQHRVMCGDSTKAMNVENLMAGAKAVLMTTDPPYGDDSVQKAKDMHSFGYGHNKSILYDYIASDDKNDKEFKVFWILFWQQPKLPVTHLSQRMSGIVPNV